MASIQSISVGWVSDNTAEFQKFPLLPLELQRMIWRQTFHYQRVIELLCHQRLGFSTRSKPPVALHICHESRMVALQRYKLLFNRIPIAVTTDVVNIKRYPVERGSDFMVPPLFTQLLTSSPYYKAELSQVRNFAMHNKPDDTRWTSHFMADLQFLGPESIFIFLPMFPGTYETPIADPVLHLYARPNHYQMQSMDRFVRGNIQASLDIGYLKERVNDHGRLDLTWD